eukprot:CAMPEP_0180797708 /NCGR_PEP_ID=MMETSP1038_2-20121128/57530_2 /TAXON_ID=632150 /ORGANISM="Azadinium spinosum, Strain 3D9" /LENGTH=44 /DNA_ID= /DNA_START= /DNA_END= /DNA_ORIENTATION=
MSSSDSVFVATSVGNARATPSKMASTRSAVRALASKNKAPSSFA